MLGHRRWKLKFLAELRRLGSPTAAARHVGIPWSTATSARRRDPVFRLAWDNARRRYRRDYPRLLELAISGDEGEGLLD